MGTTPTPVIKPKITATGFVQINSEIYGALIGEALVVLRKAKTEFESAGFEMLPLRVSTQPLVDLVGGLPAAQALAFLKQLDDLAAQEDCVVNVGPAILRDVQLPANMQILQQALSTMPHLEGSAIIADSDGILWDAIRLTAELLQYVSEHSPRSEGNLNFAAMALPNPYSPFFPGSYFRDEGQQYAFGLDCTSVVKDVFTKDKGNYAPALADLTVALTQQLTATNAAATAVQKSTSWNNRGVNVMLTPTPDVSIASAIEVYTGEKFGSGGTLTAVNLIAQAVLAAEPSGISGLTLPVLEDQLLAQRWAENAYDIDSLLAYSAVGGLGLDTIPLPGDISLGRLKRILSDVAVLATRWNTPLSARLLPAAWKKTGDKTDFQDPDLFNTTLQALP